MKITVTLDPESDNYESDLHTLMGHSQWNHARAWVTLLDYEWGVGTNLSDLSRKWGQVHEMLTKHMESLFVEIAELAEKPGR